MALIVQTQETANAEEEMNLSLEQGEGIVIVNATDASGTSHVVGKFGPGGFERQPGIPADTGWPLDGDGKIIII